jgi:hypothetical protein
VQQRGVFIYYHGEIVVSGCTAVFAVVGNRSNLIGRIPVNIINSIQVWRGRGGSLNQKNFIITNLAHCSHRINRIIITAIIIKRTESILFIVGWKARIRKSISRHT